MNNEMKDTDDTRETAREPEAAGDADDVGDVGNIPTPPTEPSGNAEQDRDARAPADDAVAKLRREAAAYRTDRNRLREQLEILQRAEVERLAEARAEGFTPLREGGDLWKDGVELEAVLGDDGNIDPDAVRAKAAEVGDRHPHWRSMGPAGDVDQNRGEPPAPEGPSFGAALKGRA